MLIKELALNPTKLKQLLEAVRNHTITIEQATAELNALPFVELEHAIIDTERGQRTGFPEVVYCRHKTVQQIIDIVEAMLESGSDVLATALKVEYWQQIKARFPEAYYNELAGVMRLSRTAKPLNSDYNIAIVAAGTSDLPVVEEAYETITAFGYRAFRLVDVGVAGLHRLLAKIEQIKRADVVIVVAGMDGALPSVVAGLIDKPLIAVPTSVGYGASFGGVSALLTMLNSCSAGVTVVNIDNGFGAAYAALQILRLVQNRGDKW